MTPAPEYYKELLLFLATAGVIVPLFGRLKLSPVFGFLAAGVVLGPFGLGALAKDVTWLSPVSITDVEQIALVAEIGIARRVTALTAVGGMPSARPAPLS